jgi:hypothetical protein
MATTVLPKNLVTMIDEFLSSYSVLYEFVPLVEVFGRLSLLTFEEAECRLQ